MKTDDPIYTPQHRRSMVEDEIIDKEALELHQKGSDSKDMDVSV